MGLAASQARLLFITARKSDVEFGEMKIANEKISLSRQSEAIATDYSNALDQKKLTWATDGTSTSDVTTDLTYNTLMQPGNVSGQFLYTNCNGNVVLSSQYANIFGGNSGSTTSGTNGAITCDAFLAALGVTRPTGYVSKYTENANGTITYNSNKTVGNNNPSTTEAPTDLLKSITNGFNDLKDIMSDNGLMTSGCRTMSETTKNKMLDLIATQTEEITSLCARYDKENATDKEKEQLARLKEMITILATAKTQVENAYASSQVGGTDAIANIAILKAILFGSSIGDICNKNYDDGTQHGVAFDYLRSYNTALNPQGKQALQNYKDHPSMSTLTAYLKAIKDYGGDPNTGCAHNLNASLESFTYEFNKESEDNDNNGQVITPDEVKSRNVDFYENLYYAIRCKGWTRDDNVTDKSYLQNGVQSGNINILQFNSGQWSALSATSPLREEDDKAAADKAEAKYNAEKAKINSKEAKLDLDMKNLDAERAMLDTEIDSVNNILKKNTERTFKYMQG